MVVAVVVLGLAVLFLLVLLATLITRGGKVETKDMELALSKVWKESGLDQTVGELNVQAKDIKDSHRSIEQMLRIPLERASLGEMSLETILSDQLPPDMFSIRTRVFDGKIPDACIRSTVGLICIDSKFPLDNYREMMESQEPKEAEALKGRFIRDVRGHFDKIAADYVCPEQGSAEFAFAYIPSEGVYYFLVNEAYSMLRDFTSKGVQVVSPLTLSHKVELIKTGVHAKKLSENAARVEKDIQALGRQFNAVDEAWRVFYGTHFRNANNKADELDQVYRKLREEFDRISKLS